MKLFRSTFLIREENYAKAAEAILRAVPEIDHLIEVDDIFAPSAEFITVQYGLNRVGLYADPGMKGGIEVFNCDRWMGDDTITLMEQVFKAISKSVEPGAYIEFWDGDSLIHYDFLYDTVERCTVPHILYSSREVI